MDKVYQNEPVMCAVSVSKGNVAEESTCSGILIDAKNGVVLTHASVIASQLPKHSSIIKDLDNSIWSRKPELSNFEVKVFFPPSILKSMFQGNMKLTRIHTSLLNSEQIDTVSAQTFSAFIYGVLKVPHLAIVLQKLMPYEYWDFVEDLKPPELDKRKRMNKEEAYFNKLLPCFTLIKVENWIPFGNVFSVKGALENSIGDTVEIIGTPFGSLNTDVFLNSRSRGVISNIAGKDKVLLLTDTRCVPGSEGGALFSCEGNRRELTGIMIATLCWKNNEWVGLSMACAISHILDAVTSLHLQIDLPISRRKVSSWMTAPSLHATMKTVAMVTVNGTWGSGFVLWQKGNQEVVMTCSHVVKGARTNNVYLKFPDSQRKAGTVLYRAPLNRQFDLALLKCIAQKGKTNYSKLGKAQEGDEVFVIGHGVFGEHHDLGPTVTSGIVSKVLSVNNIPIMIQTTCAVHAGASGGPVVNTKGEVIAITVCNAKDVGSNASYPHVNMCIPIQTILPVLQKYRKLENIDILNDLEIHSPLVHRLWSLESSTSTNPPLSQL